MAYWRMQVHPSDPKLAIKHTVESLAAGYVGLDFGADIGDLSKVDPGILPSSKKDYLAFANKMEIGDHILIIAHHFPVALVQVADSYNYIRTPAPEIGVWFRHFRKVKEVRYFADFKTNASSWTQIKMTDTISPLHDTKSISYRLIEEWRSSFEDL